MGIITIILAIATPEGNQTQVVNSWKDGLQGGTMASQIATSSQLTLNGKESKEL